MTRKTLTYIVIALGVFYLLLAVISFYEYRDLVGTFKGFGVSEADFNTFEDIVWVRNALLGGAIVCSLLGVVTLSIGTALYLRKRWAERAWLALTILLLCLHVYRLVEVFSWGAFWIVERIVELVLVVALVIFSWKVLSIGTAKPLPSTGAT